MKKTVNFFLLVFAFGNSLYAQTTDTAFASVRYSFTHVVDTTQPDNPNTENMILYLGQNMSNYTSYDRILRTAKAKADGEQRAANATFSTGGNIVTSGAVSGVSSDGSRVIFMGSLPGMAQVNSYYKNMSASSLSFISTAGGKIFAVEETTPAIDWTITQETKEIQGLQCQKATGSFKGRIYEAWFCSQLPYSNGPWKLGGLPGLILEASDTKKEVMFKFIAFENAAGAQTAIEIPAVALKTTPKEFKQYQDALKRDREATMGSTRGDVVAGNVLISVTGRMTSADGKPVKPKQMNNPIEKE